ncbi:MAG: glycosyl transferase [Reichenbachiella sp.]
MPNKVLIITYYWPPSGGGGVQRWLKFSKYLPEFGWEPIIFTPENPEFELKDESLFNDVHESIEVLKFPIWEPFSIYKKMFSKSASKNLKQGVVKEKSQLSVFDKMIVWIRGNIFIPDPRVFWVKPSVKFLCDYIQDNEIDIVVTSGPPHSMHLIGRGLKRKIGVEWIADFRDPWSDWDILDKLKTSGIAKAIHKRKELTVLNEADIVLTVTNRLGSLFAKKIESTKTKVITNGIDESDITIDEPQFNKFRITHIGLLNDLRDPTELWNVLSELCNENEDFKSDLEILLAGTISSTILAKLNSVDISRESIVVKDYIEHQDVFKYYQQSTILLLLMNQTSNADWLIPAKLFEYLGANKEVLALGSQESEVHEILKNAGNDGVLEYSNRVKLKDRIMKSYENFKVQKKTTNYIGVENFYRKNLTQELVSLLDDIKLIE